MFNEFLQYINYFISPEEMIFALVGLVIIIVLFIAGRKARKRNRKKGKGRNGNNKQEN